VLVGGQRAEPQRRVTMLFGQERRQQLERGPTDLRDVAVAHCSALALDLGEEAQHVFALVPVGHGDLAAKERRRAPLDAPELEHGHRCRRGLGRHRGLALAAQSSHGACVETEHDR
jgi:hypothetical protein